MPSFSLADEIAKNLSSAGGFGNLYSDANPRVFVGLEPADAVADSITVLDAVGGRTVSALGEEHVFEIRVRNPSGASAMLTARQLWAYLTENGTGGQGAYGDILVANLTSNAPPQLLGKAEGPDGGSWRTSQFFTALIKASSFTGA